MSRGIGVYMSIHTVSMLVQRVFTCYISPTFGGSGSSEMYLRGACFLNFIPRMCRGGMSYREKETYGTYVIVGVVERTPCRGGSGISEMCALYISFLGSTD